MEELLKEIKELEAEIELLQKEYAAECKLIYDQKGFDYYKPKWNKKIEKVADKYADLLLPLKEQYNKAFTQIEKLAEEQRKNKYENV